MKLSDGHWDVAHDVLDELIERFGAGPYHDEPPRLRLLWDTKEPLYGWYDPGWISVNLAICESWEDVIGTIIHEYCHHLQDPDRTDRKTYEEEAARFTVKQMRLINGGEA